MKKQISTGILFAIILSCASLGTANTMELHATSVTDSAQQSSSASDSTLAKLGIVPGTLSPAFSPDVYTYSATVDSDVTSVAIPASPNAQGAVIAAVNGAKTIVPGANQITIIVEAADGSESTYTINVTCGTAEAADTAADGQQVVGTVTDTSKEKKTETEATANKTVAATVLDDGSLVYKGQTYESEDLTSDSASVSLEKYNSLYEKNQKLKNDKAKLLMISIVAGVILLFIILNLSLKVYDLRHDNEEDEEDHDDDETPDAVDTETLEKQAIQLEKQVRMQQRLQSEKKRAEIIKNQSAAVSESAAVKRTEIKPEVKQEAPKTVVKNAEKRKKKASKKGILSIFHRKNKDEDEELEIIDLNDL